MEESPGSSDFYGIFYQICKGKLVPILLTVFQIIEE